MRKQHIVIADDHRIVRDGIKALLEDISTFEVVGEAADGRQVLELVEVNRDVDIIIMDINMPNMDGIRCTERVKEYDDGIKVLALTMMGEDEHIRNMIRAGASGYILKEAGQDELLEALETIAEGRHYFSDDAAKSVMMELVKHGGNFSEKSDSSGEIPLTRREKEVLKHICQELTNQEIADKLYISVRTVDAHRRNLLQKTGARNTAGLVRYAAEHDLMDL